MTVEPVRLLGGEALGDTLTRLRAAVAPNDEIAGWATVELDRAARDLGDARDGREDLSDEPAPPDEILGATCRLLRPSGQSDVVLLEPSTEGRLAASLARHGEGHVALYLMTDQTGAVNARAAGFALSPVAEGPFGAQRLILAGPRDGPFLILAGLDRPAPSSL